jgi:hypothetical protein
MKKIEPLAVAASLYTAGYFIPVRQASAVMRGKGENSIECMLSPMRLMIEKKMPASNKMVADRHLLAEQEPLLVYANALNKAVESAPVVERRLYRGITQCEFIGKVGDSPLGLTVKEPKAGDVLSAPGVISFTTSKKMAVRFSMGFAPGQGEAIRVVSTGSIVFIVEPPTIALDIRKYSIWRQSERVTFGQFRVLDVRKRLATACSKLGRRPVTYITIKQEDITK